MDVYIVGVLGNDYRSDCLHPSTVNCGLWRAGIKLGTELPMRCIMKTRNANGSERRDFNTVVYLIIEKRSRTDQAKIQDLDGFYNTQGGRACLGPKVHICEEFCISFMSRRGKSMSSLARYRKGGRQHQIATPTFNGLLLCRDEWSNARRKRNIVAYYSMFIILWDTSVTFEYMGNLFYKRREPTGSRRPWVRPATATAKLCTWAFQASWHSREIIKWRTAQAGGGSLFCFLAEQGHIPNSFQDRSPTFRCILD